MIPALFHFTSPSAEREISLQIAAILLLVYVLSLVYTLFTHRKLFEIKPGGRTRGSEDPLVEDGSRLSGGRDCGPGTHE